MQWKIKRIAGQRRCSRNARVVSLHKRPKLWRVAPSAPSCKSRKLLHLPAPFRSPFT